MNRDDREHGSGKRPPSRNSSQSQQQQQQPPPPPHHHHHHNHHHRPQNHSHHPMHGSAPPATQAMPPLHRAPRSPTASYSHNPGIPPSRGHYAASLPPSPPSGSAGLGSASYGYPAPPPPLPRDDGGPQASRERWRQPPPFPSPRSDPMSMSSILGPSSMAMQESPESRPPMSRLDRERERDRDRDWDLQRDRDRDHERSRSAYPAAPPLMVGGERRSPTMSMTAPGTAATSPSTQLPPRRKWSGSAGDEYMSAAAAASWRERDREREREMEFEREREISWRSSSHRPQHAGPTHVRVPSSELHYHGVPSGHSPREVHSSSALPPRQSPIASNRRSRRSREPSDEMPLAASGRQPGPYPGHFDDPRQPGGPPREGPPHGPALPTHPVMPPPHRSPERSRVAVGYSMHDDIERDREREYRMRERERDHGLRERDRERERMAADRYGRPLAPDAVMIDETPYDRYGSAVPHSPPPGPRGPPPPPPPGTGAPLRGPYDGRSGPPPGPDFQPVSPGQVRPASERRKERANLEAQSQAQMQTQPHPQPARERELDRDRESQRDWEWERDREKQPASYGPREVLGTAPPPPSTASSSYPGGVISRETPTEFERPLRAGHFPSAPTQGAAFASAKREAAGPPPPPQAGPPFTPLPDRAHGVSRDAPLPLASGVPPQPPSAPLHSYTNAERDAALEREQRERDKEREREQEKRERRKAEKLAAAQEKERERERGREREREREMIDREREMELERAHAQAQVAAQMQGQAIGDLPFGMRPPPGSLEDAMLAAAQNQAFIAAHQQALGRPPTVGEIQAAVQQAMAAGYPPGVVLPPGVNPAAAFGLGPAVGPQPHIVRDPNAGPRVDSEPVWLYLELCERDEAIRRLQSLPLDVSGEPPSPIGDGDGAAVAATAVVAREQAGVNDEDMVNAEVRPVSPRTERAEDAQTEEIKAIARQSEPTPSTPSRRAPVDAAPPDPLPRHLIGMDKGRPVRHLGSWLYDPTIDPLFPAELLAKNIGATIEVRIPGDLLSQFRRGGPEWAGFVELERNALDRREMGEPLQLLMESGPGRLALEGRGNGWKLGWRGKEHARMSFEMRIEERIAEAALFREKLGRQRAAEPVQQKGPARASGQNGHAAAEEPPEEEDDQGKGRGPERELASPWRFWRLTPLLRRKLWGTDVYTDDSDVLAMCVHAGWVEGPSLEPEGVPAWVPPGRAARAWNGLSASASESFDTRRESAPTAAPRRGKTNQPSDLSVILRIAPKLIAYKGCQRGGIKSRSWGNTHDGVSLVVESVELKQPGFASGPARRMAKNRIDAAARFKMRVRLDSSPSSTSPSSPSSSVRALSARGVGEEHTATRLAEAIQSHSPGLALASLGMVALRDVALAKRKCDGVDGEEEAVEAVVTSEGGRDARAKRSKRDETRWFWDLPLAKLAAK